MKIHAGVAVHLRVKNAWSHPSVGGRLGGLDGLDDARAASHSLAFASAIVAGDDFGDVGHGRLWFNRVVPPKSFRERPAQYADFPPQGKVCQLGRAIGVTSHQHDFAAELANTGRIDCQMIRYTADHRDAETEVFLVTKALDLPVISNTGVRWGALLENTPDDPLNFTTPPAPDWYRFTLCHPGVTVSLMAPNGRAEPD